MTAKLSPAQMNPRLTDRQRELNIIGCKMILANMEEDVADRALAVWTIEQESGLSRQALAVAGMTAWQASLFWRHTDPDLGRKLLEQRLAQLTGEE